MALRSLVAHVGGIFLYSTDPASLATWYQKHLLLSWDFQQEGSLYGKAFSYIPEGAESGTDLPKSAVVWSIQKASDAMAQDGVMKAVVNYRVHNMEEVKTHLATLGLELDVKHYEGEGFFAHIHDPEGNKIELWQDQFKY